MNTARTVPRVTHPFDLEVTLPGSKSIALRQLLISALADAPTTLLGVPRCDDVEDMTAALRALGVGVIETGPSRVAVEPAGLARDRRDRDPAPAQRGLDAAAASGRGPAARPDAARRARATACPAQSRHG